MRLVGDLPANSPDLWTFLTRWTVPTCRWTCLEGMTACVPLTHCPVQEALSRGRVPRSTLHCLQPLVDAERLRHKLLQELRVTELHMQQSSASTPAAFDLQSPYPQNVPLVPQIGSLAYRFGAVRRLWLGYAASVPLTTWLQCTAMHCVLFYRCLLEWVLTTFPLQLVNASELPNPSLHLPHPSAAERVRQQVTAMHSPPSRPYATSTPRAMHPRHRRKFERAARLVFGVDLAVDVPPHIRTELPFSQFPNQAAIDFGSWSTTYAFARKRQYCCALYIPLSWDTPMAIHGPAADILRTLRLPCPVRVACIIPEHWMHDAPLWHATHAAYHHYTFMDGPVCGGSFRLRGFLLQNPAAAALGPVHFQLIVAHLGPILRALKIHIPRAPRDKPEPAGRVLCTQTTLPNPYQASSPYYYVPLDTSGKALFWHTWNAEWTSRKTTLGTRPVCRQHLVASWRRCNEVLPLAPQHWLRRLAQLVHWPTAHDIDTKAQWVYAVWTPLDPRQYFGQTGAISQPRSVTDRVLEEIGSAQSWVVMYQGKMSQGPLYIRAMHALGPWNFNPIPLLPTDICNTDLIERRFIQNVTPNLNEQRHRRRSYFRWLVRGNMSKALPLATLRDPDVWTKLQQSSRATVRPQDALKILSLARRDMAPHQFSALQGKLLPYIQRQTGVRLPKSLPLRLPVQDPAVKKPVKRLFRDFLRSTKLPAVMCTYLASIFSVVLCSPCKLSRLLSDGRVTSSLADLRQSLTHSTPCASQLHTQPNIATTTPCTAPQLECACPTPAWFTREEIRHVTSPRFSSVFDVGSNFVLSKTPRELCRATSEALRTLHSALPKRRPFPFPKFADAVQDQIKLACTHNPTPHATPPTVPLTRRFKEDHPRLRVIFLDKNCLCYVLFCWRFWVQIILNAYDRPEYTLYRTYSSPEACRSILLLYYYYLALTFPVLRKYVPPRRLRRNLTLNMPWLKAARLPPPPKMCTIVPTSEAEAARARDLLVSHAEQVFQHTSARARDLGLGPPDSLHLPARHGKWKVPTTEGLAKQKSIPVKPSRDVATREVFSHAGHPLNPQFRHASRISSLLERRYTCSFFTLNVLNQEHLIEGFLKPAREFYSAQGIPVGGGELDVVRMFPSLKKEKIIAARKKLYERWKPMLDLQRGTKEVNFSISKSANKKLDEVGAKGANLWHVYTAQECLELALLNLFLNDFFVTGSELRRQTEGAAIGGLLSAQDADLCLMLPESEVPWGSTFPLSLRLARFRDNLMFFCPLQFVPYWTHHLKKFFTDLYELDLDFEQMGRSLTFLEVQVQCEGPNIRSGMKNKVLAGYLTDNPTILRFPDPHTSTARDTVHGLAIALSKKAASITTDPPFTESNFSQVVWELIHRGYPMSWWVSPVRKAYLRSDAITPWAKLKKDPRWIPPVPAKQCLLCPQYTPCPIALPQDSDCRATIRHLATAGVPLIPLKEAVTLPVQHVPPEMQHHTRKHGTPAPTARKRARPARRRTRRLTVRKRPARKQRQPAPLPPNSQRPRLTRRLGYPPPPSDAQQSKVPTKRRGRPPRTATVVRPRAPPRPREPPPPPYPRPHAATSG